MKWAPVTGFVGVLAGGLLSQFTMRYQQSAQRAERMEQQRIELYSEWINGMNRVVYAKPEKPIEILRIKLLLLESDAKLRDLIAKVQASVPDPMTKDGDEFAYLLPQDPDPSWPPFDEAVKELTGAVLASLRQ